ncbi:MAG: GntR family transcriptional regulator, partial [Firmicutes bacterium]|nr:GntR family transcriptional regulator [Bacillota bacterium]
MDFNLHKPIYLQISDNICNRILQKELESNDRIPSIRELGIEMGVNPNTVMRTYEYLQNKEIIYNKR